MFRFRTNRINRFGYYSGINSINNFNLFNSLNLDIFNCYLYLGSNINLQFNKNLNKYNSKILNIYQNSHWDENFDFVDIILPNLSFFEKRTQLYINCLGLIKRIPSLFSILNKNLFDDLEILNLFIQLFPQYKTIPNYEIVQTNYIK